MRCIKEEIISDGTTILDGSFYIIQSIILAMIKTRKTYKYYVERNLQKYDVIFSENSINIISSEEKLKVEYENISKIFENKIEYVFISQAKRYIIIPKRCINDENLFRKYIDELVGKYKIRQVIKTSNII